MTTTTSLPAPLDVKLMNWTAAVLFVGCAAAVLVAAGSWARHHPMFAIGRIVVQGELVHNNAVTLRANVGPHLVGNFFTMDLAAVREAFEQVPWVRRAMVRREFPNSLRVELQEHDAFAYWGPEEGSTLLSTRGEVFEASPDDVDEDELPRLQGPQGQSAAVMQMYQRLAPIVEPLGARLATLELSPRGSWRGSLTSGASLELGGGSPDDVEMRTRRFVRTLARVTAQYGRRADALESADLRHPDGYAMRLRGVTTVEGDVPRAAPRAAARRPAGGSSSNNGARREPPRNR
ncbi:cell division protein FtsQ/DivIB [Acidovorax sp. PRC11]|nr:cell division protein FtsQ/DivIB [Acidovorax sp. PRC11]MDT0137501.1 cell division protein FtsQ/DivIB [Acidovorax sp. PRC11]